MTLKLKAVSETDETRIYATRADGTTVGLVATVAHPDGDWDLVSRVAPSLPAAIYDAMQEFPVEEV